MNKFLLFKHENAIIKVEINVWSQALLLAGKGLYFISQTFYGHIQKSNYSLRKDLMYSYILCSVNSKFSRLI